MWTWGAPAMLGWLAAAFIPLLLWWWHRPRRQEMPFAAMQFLERAILREGGRRNWLQWWLLALQMAALVLLALGWADAQWLTDRNSLREHTWQILVIDGTMSMSCDAAGNPRAGRSNFDQAVRQARQTVQAGRSGDLFSLFVVRDRCEAVIGSPTKDAAAVLQALDQLQVSAARGEITSLQQPLQALLSRDFEANERASRAIVHLYSDLQTHTWPADAADAFSKVQPADKNLALEWQLHAIGKVASDNLAVEQLVSDDSWVFAGQTTTLRGTVRNYHSEDRDVLARWLVDQQLVGEQVVTVPARSTAAVSRLQRFATAGNQAVELAIADDSLELDNRRCLAISVRRQVRILAIGGRADSTRPAAIAWSLNDGQNTSAVQVDERSTLSALAGDLANYDLLLLADVPGLSSAESDQIQRYLDQGGNVLVLLGDRSSAGAWSSIDWLPAEVSPPAAAQKTTFAANEFQHPLLQVFRGTAGGGLTTVPIWQHYELRARENSEVVLSFADQSPAVIAGSSSNGRVVLWSLPWDSLSQVQLADGSTTPWTALSQWPCFVPLADQSLRYLVAGNQQRQEVFVGQTLSGVTPSATSGQRLTIKRPDGRVDQLAVRSAGGRSNWSYASTDLPGCYELSLGEDVPNALWAVNVDPAESDPATRSATNLIPASSERNLATWEQLVRTFPWYRLFLGLALAALVVESFLRWQWERISS